ncbi:hypothetical protein DIPPA_14722 [Diplonema papillatum]|nr:hypothetical protein DIPPA_14722 [Diplonema papillatum]
MDARIEKWIRNKGVTIRAEMGCVLDLWCGQETRPQYLPMTAVERWASVSRLVLGRSETVPKRRQQACLQQQRKTEGGRATDVVQRKDAREKDLAAYRELMAAPATVVDPKTGRPRLFYSGAALPDLLTFDLEAPDDELLAMHNVLQYQKAIDCFRARERRAGLKGKARPPSG